MSSDFNYIALLTLAQVNLYKFAGPLLITIGTCSCIISSVVLSKKNLRKSPCSVYFIAYNIASLLLLYMSILPQTLDKGYTIDLTLYNLVLCRLRLYTLLLSDVLGPSYLILAAVDRVLLTSRNALIRKRSTHRLAFICITSVTLFWMLADSHTLVLGRIIEITPGFSFCYFQLDNYYIFVSYYSAIVKGILIPLLMLIFGLWTIKNVQSLGRVSHVSGVPVNETIGTTGLRANQSKDRQLIKILIVDISVYLIFTTMLSVVLIYQQIIPDSSQSIVETQFRIFLVVISSFICFIPSCIGFYINLFVSKTFRHDAKDVLMCK